MNVPNKIIVLGASGFIGSSLMPELLKKASPVITVNSGELDLTTDQSAVLLDKIISHGDTLVFLSCLTPDKLPGPKLHQQNIRMGENVKVVALEKKLKVIYLSSDAVYGSSIENVMDNTNSCPDSPYGESHLLREQMFAPLENVTILRSTMVFGKGDTHNSYGPNRFHNDLLRQNVVNLFGNGEELRDYIYIDDLIRCIISAIYEDIPGCFNIVTGKSISFSDLAKVMCLINKGGTTIHLSRQVEISHRRYFTKHIENHFGFVPLPIIEGLNQMFSKEKITSCSVAASGGSDLR